MEKNSIIGDLVSIIPCQNVLGEGVIWHDAKQEIFWLDIESSILFSYNHKETKTTHFKMPHRLCSFAFIDKNSDLSLCQHLNGWQEDMNDIIIAAFDKGIALYNLKSAEIHWINKPEEQILGNRLNDGKVDKQGRFWVGSFVENKQENNQQAYLYCIDNNLNVHQVLRGLSISNSLCVSVDGKKLYHTDTPKQRINQYHICDKTVGLSNKKLFVNTDKNCFPDGSTIDASDHLWNAQWGGSKVVRYTESGDVDLELKLPISQPSCVAIGGPNNDWLIITTAKIGLSEQEIKQQPLAGDLFIYQLNDVKGVTEPPYLITNTVQ